MEFLSEVFYDRAVRCRHLYTGQDGQLELDLLRRLQPVQRREERRGAVVQSQRGARVITARAVNSDPITSSCRESERAICGGAVFHRSTTSRSGLRLLHGEDVS